MINYKFIFTATLTFIPYTVLWFFWHNNLFPDIYYSADLLYSIQTQNVWAMNFANALLVYGFVYFFRGWKGEHKSIYSLLWGVYYNISVIGFFNFMLFGMTNNWSSTLLLYDMVWAITGGVYCGAVVYLLKKKITP